jgi:hypothetical protein
MARVATPDDLVELRLVAMPADSRAGFVFVDENLLERLRWPVENLSDLAPQGHEKGRKRRGLDDRAPVVIVAIAEARHPAIGQEALKVERLEQERFKLAGEGLVFCGR